MPRGPGSVPLLFYSHTLPIIGEQHSAAYGDSCLVLEEFIERRFQSVRSSTLVVKLYSCATVLTTLRATGDILPDEGNRE